MAEHGVVGAGVLYGSIQFAFDAGDGLEEELAEVAKRVGRLVRDALFCESRKDLAQDVVDIRDGVELAGKGGKLGSELIGFEKLLFFAGMKDAERGMVLLAEHTAGAAVGELAETLVAVWIERV